jgi:hypothetical protein
MVARAARERLRTWFAGQVQARSDGFLVRPLGRLGGVVLLQDKGAVSEYASRRVALALHELAGRCVYGTFVLAALAITFLDFQLAQVVLGPATRFAVVLALIVSVLIGAPWLVRWQIYRWACHIGRPVSRTGWCGGPPPEKVPIAFVPGWFIVAFVALVGLGGTAVAASIAWRLSRDGSVGPLGWLYVALLIGFCWTMSVHAVWQWLRANRQPV